MSKVYCCKSVTEQDQGQNALWRRAGAAGQWLSASLPAALVILLPKCPVCLAGYLAVGTGIGLSVSTATHVRHALIGASCVLFLLPALASLRRKRSRPSA